MTDQSRPVIDRWRQVAVSVRQTGARSPSTRSEHRYGAATHWRFRLIHQVGRFGNQTGKKWAYFVAESIRPKLIAESIGLNNYQHETFQVPTFTHWTGFSIRPWSIGRIGLYNMPRTHRIKDTKMSVGPSGLVFANFPWISRSAFRQNHTISARFFTKLTSVLVFAEVNFLLLRHGWRSNVTARSDILSVVLWAG